jgi:hypothetical protein
MTDQMDIKRKICSLHNEAIKLLEEAQAITEQVALKNALASALAAEIKDLTKKLEA